MEDIVPVDGEDEMKEQEFISLLQSHQECLFDEKKFRAILSDLFPRDVQMNNILVNLFHLGLPREIEELQVINDPVYYKYKKKVVKIYGIDQKLADDAIRFWCICYGQKVLKRSVKISAIAPEVPGEQPTAQPINGVKEKNFNNCPFKVTLPQISVLDGAIKLNFRMQSKAGISVDVSLNETYLSDKLNRKYDNYFMGECKPKENGNRNFALSIPIEKRNFMLSDSVLVLYFLAGDQRRYEIAYRYRKDTGIALDYVMGRRLSNEEILRLEESIRQAKKKAPQEKEERHLEGMGRV